MFWHRNRCPRACSEGHTYVGRCQMASRRGRRKRLEGLLGDSQMVRELLGHHRRERR
jgi:hypothetical protein